SRRTLCSSRRAATRSCWALSCISLRRETLWSVGARCSCTSTRVGPVVTWLSIWICLSLLNRPIVIPLGNRYRGDRRLRNRQNPLELLDGGHRLPQRSLRPKLGLEGGFHLHPVVDPQLPKLPLL